MVTKNKNTNEQPKSRAQVGKLQLNKETVKELTVDKLKHIKGGLRWGDTCIDLAVSLCSEPNTLTWVSKA